MTGIVENAFVGARGIDSVQLVDAPAALRLKASGIDFVVQYLGSVTAAGVAGILAASLAFMPVTYADKFDGATTVQECQAIGYVRGGTVWLDVEGVATMDPRALIKLINAWARAVQAAGYIAGLYVGAGCPLTSLELAHLEVTRYWHSMSTVMDRNGALAMPVGCGWSMFQAYDSRDWAGVWIDVDFIQRDNRRRVPTWMIKA